MVAELRAGRRPSEERLVALKAAEDLKRKSLKEKVRRELGEGATSLIFNQEEIEGLMNQMTHMLITRAGGGFFDIAAATSAKIKDSELEIQTTGHIEQNVLVKKIDAAFQNNSIYRNTAVPDVTIKGGVRNTLEHISMEFLPTRGEIFLTSSKAEKTTRGAMGRIGETIGETLQSMTQGVDGISINPYRIGLNIQPEGLHVMLLEPAAPQQ